MHDEPLPVIMHDAPLPVIMHDEPLPVIMHDEPLPVIMHDEPLPVIMHDEPLPVIMHDEPLPVITHDEPLPVITHESAIRRVHVLPVPLDVNRIVIAISWISLESFVFAHCGGYEIALDSTRASHDIVQSTLLFSFFFCRTGCIGSTGANVYPTDHLRRNEVGQDTL